MNGKFKDIVRKRTVQSSNVYTKLKREKRTDDPNLEVIGLTMITEAME